MNLVIIKIICAWMTLFFFFYYLLNGIRPRIEKRNTVVRDAVSAEETLQR